MKAKKPSSLLYREYLFVVIDYLATATFSEIVFDVLVPLAGAACAYFIYLWKPIEADAAQQLVEMLTTTLSILIGFTVTSVTILATSGNPNIEALKNEKTERSRDGKPISLYKAANISLFFVLLSELFALGFAAVLMFFPFLLHTYRLLLCAVCFGLFAHVLLTNVRCMTSLYFIFWNDKPTPLSESQPPS